MVRHDDSFADFLQKVRLATILGTIQSSLTKFKYLRRIWADNCNEERLLGVGLAGVYDNLPLFTRERLNLLRSEAEDTNKEWAQKLRINPSAAITCTKPDGNSSQLCDTASGIHPRYAEYYIRTIRGDGKDPLTQMMIDQGIPYEADKMPGAVNSFVFSFPQRSPENAVLREEVSAIEHLELWKLIREEWCHHNPSVTVSVREHEWMDVQAWVYKNFDSVCGISFLPFNDDDHVYPQAPYQKCSKEVYEAAVKGMPKVDWSKLKEYEEEDATVGSTTLACTANGCEVNYL